MRRLREYQHDVASLDIRHFAYLCPLGFEKIDALRYFLSSVVWRLFNYQQWNPPVIFAKKILVNSMKKAEQIIRNLAIKPTDF